MNKLETNALRIAELMGYKINSYDSRLYMKDSFCYGNIELIAKFNNYNGLMPIVFEFMYQQQYFSGAIDDICISIEKYYPEDDSYDNESFDFDLEKENPFIEPIQLACIKYLELRNDNSRIQQTI